MKKKKVSNVQGSNCSPTGRDLKPDNCGKGKLGVVGRKYIKPGVLYQASDEIMETFPNCQGVVLYYD